MYDNNKFLQMGHFKTVLQEYQTIITTAIFLEFGIVCYVDEYPQYYRYLLRKICTLSLQSRMRCFKFGHYVCNNWQLLSVIILIRINLDNLHESMKYSCSDVKYHKNSEN